MSEARNRPTFHHLTNRQLAGRLATLEQKDPHGEAIRHEAASRLRGFANDGGVDPRSPPVSFPYVNWRGAYGVRTVIVDSVRHGVSEYHPRPDLLLVGLDAEKGVTREYSLEGILKGAAVRAVEGADVIPGDAPVGVVEAAQAVLRASVRGGDARCVPVGTMRALETALEVAGYPVPGEP